MSSIDNLAKDLVKIMHKTDEKGPKPYEPIATVVKEDENNGDILWVKIPGSNSDTPVEKTINANPGDSVRVRVSGGRAWVVGNASNPPTDDARANQVGAAAQPSIDFVAALADKDVTVRSITAATGYIDDLYSKNITTENLRATTGYIKDLTSENITAENIVADHIDVGDLKANKADIDLANVEVAWIEQGNIKKAEVFDENVFDLSGNRATISRIDASKINVANLRADNLVVRRINGQPVVGGYTLISNTSPGYESKNPQALGWYEFVNAQWVLSTDTTVDMTKAYYQEGNEVSLYDQQYIDGLESDLQQQIDGAVQTYTGAVVPTLTNWPYTDWYDTSVTPIHDERAKHVGDIYYVVNSSSDEGGYCYRFAYDNTEHAYSWVLIKDSDVTKALSDISELQTFESETTSWIDETDEGLETIRTNHTALSGRVDDVEATANAALPATTFETFESTTFTDLVDEVDEQSTTMTNMTTRLGLNADGTQSATDIVSKESALEQTVNGISTRVGKTEMHLAGMYATSSTAAGTAAKVATIVPTLANYELANGAMVTVKFVNDNTTSSPTLNLNSTGAKPIKTYSGGNLTEAEYKWKAGSTFTFTYNGTNWLMQDSTASVRMTTAETEIQQTSNNVLIKATRTEATDAEKTAGGTSAIGLINVSPDNVVIAAKHVDIAGAAIFNNYSTTQQMNSAIGTAVDGIEVGGRNLLKDSTNLIGNWSYNQATVSDGIATISPTQTGDMRIYQMPANSYFTPEANTVYTISVEAKSSNGAKLGFFPYWANAGSKTFTVTSNWARYSWTFTSGASVSTGSTTISAADGVTGVTLMVRNPKLEKGNKATDWTPAPEDVQAGIDAKKSIHTMTAYPTGEATTIYSLPYTSLLNYSRDGTTGLNAFVESIEGVENGDTVRLAYAVSDMNNAVVYMVGKVTSTASGSSSYKPRIYYTAHGLDTTIIDGGNILTNSIGANQIKAGAINAKRIAVGDYNNYITATEKDENSLDTGANPVISGGWLFKSNATAATMWLSPVLSRWFTSGEKYRITGTVKTPAAGSATIAIYGRDANGVSIGAYSCTVVIPSANTEVQVDKVITIGTDSSATNAQTANVTIIFSTTSTWTSNYQQGYCKNMKCERMSGGELIVDGSITADKIATGAITIGDMAADTKSEVLNSNISIGGRNLLPDSGSSKGYYLFSGTNVAKTSWSNMTWNSAEDAAYSTSSATGATMVGQLGFITIKPVVGNKYTLSGDIKVVSTDSLQVGAQWRDQSNAAITFGDVHAIADSNNTWKHFEISADFPSSVSATDARITFIKSSSTSASWTVYLKNIKLEKGNKATDWTPAPEDVLADGNLTGSSLAGKYAGGSVSIGSWTNVTVKGNTYSVTGNPNDLVGFRGMGLTGSYVTFSYETDLSSTTNYYTFKDASLNIIQSQTNVTVTPINGVVKYTLAIPSGASVIDIGFGKYPYTAAYYVRNPRIALGYDDEASDCITKIDNNGIRIHPSSTENNSVLINASGVTLYKGGTTDAYRIAQYGDTARIGKPAGKHVNINDSGMTVFMGDENTASNNVATFGSTARIGPTSAGYVSIGTSSIDLYKGSTHIGQFSEYTSGTGQLTIYGANNGGLHLYPALLELYGSDTFDNAWYTSSYIRFGKSGSNIQINAVGANDKYSALIISSSGVSDFYLSVTGRISASNYISTSNGLYMTTNDKAIYCKDTTSTDMDVLRVDSGNALVLGYGHYTKNASGYNAWLEGYNVYLRARQKCYANGSQITTSDKRLKKDIVPISDKFKQLFMDLQPVEYKMEQSEDKDIHLGLTAQDVEMAFMKNNISIEKYALVDEYEYPEEKTRYKALAYTEFIPMCIQMIQSQQEEINTLKGEVNALRSN